MGECLLDRVRNMSDEKIEEKLTSFPVPLFERRQKNVQAAVLTAGLENSDIWGVFLELLEDTPEKVLQGIRIAGYIWGIKELQLYIPEYRKELAEMIRPGALEAGIEVINDLIDSRQKQEQLFLHIGEAVDLYDLFSDSYEEGYYLAVDGKRLEKFSGETFIKELLQDGAKGAEVGYRVYSQDELEIQIKEVDVSNGIVRSIMDGDCIVNLVQERLQRFRDGSCGKCVFCREGLIQLHEMEKDIVQGKGKREYPAYAEEIAEAMQYSTMCTLGQKAPEIVLSAQNDFREEIDVHIKRKKCPAGVCFSEKMVYIDPKSCTGCGECLAECPNDAITGKRKYIHMIDSLDCQKCGACITACDEGCIHMTEGKVLKLPQKLTKCGRFRR